MMTLLIIAGEPAENFHAVNLRWQNTANLIPIMRESAADFDGHLRNTLLGAVTFGQF